MLLVAAASIAASAAVRRCSGGTWSGSVAWGWAVSLAMCAGFPGADPGGPRATASPRSEHGGDEHQHGHRL